VVKPRRATVERRGSRRFCPPPDEMRGRLRRTRAVMRRAGLDGLLLFSSFLAKEGHVCYLTNHKITQSPWSFYRGNNGFGFSAAVLPRDGDLILVAGTRYDRGAVAPIVRDVRVGFDFDALLRDAVRDAGLNRARVGVAGTDVMPLYYVDRVRRAFPRLRLEDADDLIEGVRVVKTPFEIKIMGEAAAICDKGLEAAFRASRVGATEVEIADAAYVACMEAGADRVDRTRVRAGRELSAWARWPFATGHRVASGDLVYFDLVGWYKNYVFDESRTWAVPKPDAWQRSFLEEGLHITERMRETAKPGMTIGAWVQETIDYFRPRAFGTALSIVGHGVGLEVVENPWFLPEVATPLTPGMVLCLESGFVIEDKAALVRIEKEIVIERSGARFLGRFDGRLWK